MFQGTIVQRNLPDIVTWQDEVRPATEAEIERMTKLVAAERLRDLITQGNAGSDSNLLFPVVNDGGSRKASDRTQSAELLVKSLRRLHTAYSHKFVSSVTNTWTPAPVYCVKVHEDFVFTGADDWVLRKFKINRSPSTPDEPMLQLQASYYGHASVVTDFVVLDVNQTSTFLCSCSPDRTVRVYRVTPDDAFVCFITFDADVPYIAESRGKLVACSEIGELVVVPGDSLVESGTSSPGGLFRGRGLKRVFASASRHTQVRGFAVHEDSAYIALSDKTIKVYDVASCNLVHVLDLLRLHSKPVSEIAVTNYQTWNSSSSQLVDQQRLASSDDHGNLVLWRDRSPYPLLSTSHGSLRLSDDSLLESRLMRVRDRQSNLFFTIDVTAFMTFDSLRAPLLLASAAVFADRARENLLFAAVLIFDTQTCNLVDVIESFEDRIFVIRPVPHTDLVMIAGHDGDLAIFTVSRESTFTEVNRFSMATRHRVTRRVLDAWISPKLTRAVKTRGTPQLVDLTIACTDSFGSVSLFGACEVGALRGLDDEEAQKYRDAYSHQFFVGDYSEEPQESLVRSHSQVCDFRGRAGRLHHFPEDPLPTFGSGYALRGKPGQLPPCPSLTLAPRVSNRVLTAQVSDSSGASPPTMLIDIVDAGDMSDSSDTSFSSSVRVRTRTRNRNVIGSDAEESSNDTLLTSLVDEDESSESTDSSSDRYRDRQSRRMPTRSRSVLGVFLSPDPSPRRRSARPRRQVTYDFSENDEEPEVEIPTEQLPARPRRRPAEATVVHEDPVAVVDDLWLACDHCDRWRRVSREFFDEYNGTDKVVRCRRIGRSCDDADENPDSQEALEQPEPEVASAPVVEPVDQAGVLYGDGSPRTATGITLRRRTRVSSPVREPSPVHEASPEIDLARLRQERAERRERLREGPPPRAADSGSRRILRRRTQADLSEPSSPSVEEPADSSESSVRPRQPQRSMRRRSSRRN